MPQVIDFNLHASYSFWLCRLASAMQEQFNHILAKHDVTYPQWMLLNVLGGSTNASPAKIAQSMGVDRSAITRLVDRLEKKSLVARYHDGLDRRSIKILLTDQAKQLLPELNRLAQLHQDALLGELPTTERRAFKGDIQKLLRATGIESSDSWHSV